MPPPIPISPRKRGEMPKAEEEQDRYRSGTITSVSHFEASGSCAGSVM